jgi:hypothetical protein
MWDGPDGTHVYVWGSSDYLRDYVLDRSGRFSTQQGVCFCKAGWTVNDNSKNYTIDVDDPPCGAVSTKSPDYAAVPGGVVSVSSNGKEARTGIVWATRPVAVGSIWNSVAGEIDDSLGNWAKYTPPTIANGKVYLPTQSNQLVVYGLLSTE